MHWVSPSRRRSAATWIGLLTLFFHLAAHAGITGFRATQVDGTRTVRIVFAYEGDPDELTEMTLEVSLDGGATYVGGVSTFLDGSAFFSEPVKEGLNEIFWNAGADFPNQYVDPAFLRMNVSLKEAESFVFVPGRTPQLRVVNPVSNVELLEFLGTQTKSNFYARRFFEIPKLDVTGSTFDDLIKEVDETAWRPPGLEDEVEIKEPEIRFQPPETDLDNQPPGELKFDNYIEIRDNMPEVQQGAPELNERERPFDTRGTENPGEFQKPLPEVPVGRTATLTFRLNAYYSIEVIDASHFPGDTPPHFTNIVPENDEEVSGAVDAPQPLIFNRGDVVVAYYAGNSVADIEVYNQPLMEIGHNEKEEPFHSFGSMDSTVLRTRGPFIPKLTDIRMYRVMESNISLPLFDLREFPEISGATMQALGRLPLTEFKPIDDGSFNQDVGSIGRRSIQPRDPVGSVSVTQLWKAGPSSQKKNLVIVGDGFSSSSADQQEFMDYVDNNIMKGFAEADIQPGYLNAVNIYRVDAVSRDSGVSQIRRVNDGGNNYVQEADLDDYVDWVNQAAGTFTLKNNTYRVTGPENLDNNPDVDEYKVWTWTDRQDTAWNYAYAADWDLCWTQTLDSHEIITDRLNAAVPNWDYCWVILKTSGGGGCNRGHIVSLTTSSGVGTILHEWGHNFASLADEYERTATYTIPGRCDNEPNLDFWTGDRSDIKWNNWVPSWRPVPTTGADVAFNDIDAGVFEGGCYANTGIWRPVNSGRMRSNTPLNSPIGFTEIRDVAYDHREQDFRQNAVGDFNGDGFTDAVVSDDRQLGLFLAQDRDLGPDDPVRGQPTRSLSGTLEPTWFATDLLRGNGTSWEFRSGDIHLPANFNGDEADDLYVANLTNWNNTYLTMLRSRGDSFEPVRRYDGDLPGWDEMREHDEFYTGDFNGDGLQDLAVFNGQDWSMPYLMLYRSDGARLIPIRRYDRYLRGWERGRNEKFFMEDINGDGLTDVVAYNPTNWRLTHLHIYRSTGNDIALTERFYGEIERDGGRWPINSGDRYIFGDYDGDDTRDFALFNGTRFSTEYLGIFSFNKEGKLRFRRLYDDTIPGWNMKPSDRFQSFDRDGNGISDLIVFNTANWSTQYLGVVRMSSGYNVAASWQDDWINGWNLGSSDRIKIADFRGNGQWDDLFIFNKNWFGLLRGRQTSFRLEAIYHKWIHNQRYHRFGLY